MKQLLAATAALSLLSGCSSAGKPAESEMPVSNLGDVGEPCRYGKRPKNVYVAVKHINGLAYKGDMKPGDIEKMRSKWGSAKPKRVVTATAAPSIRVWTVTVDDNCYDPKRKVYYNCTKELRADLSHIRSMVRAVRRADARKLAVQLCQQRVLAQVARKTDTRFDHRKLRCRVIDDRWCPLPKTPPKARTGKKKSK